MDKLHIDQHISQKFNQEIEGIRTHLMAMGGLVEKQVNEAIKAVEEASSEKAQAVLDAEPKIDRMEVDIDEECTNLIARRQPTASDLRMVLSVSKMIRDLERIGDEANKIGKMAMILSEEGPSPRGHMEVRHIGDSVEAMLHDALDAFARYDTEMALEVMSRDQKINIEYKTALRELITYMMEDSRSISRVLNILWTLRALERIGDHAKNICEQVVYLVKGRDIRHRLEPN